MFLIKVYNCTIWFHDSYGLHLCVFGKTGLITVVQHLGFCSIAFWVYIIDVVSSEERVYLGGLLSNCEKDTGYIWYYNMFLSYQSFEKILP